MSRPLTESQMPDPQSPAPRRTALAAVHEGLGATMTDFAGWLMPLRYGSETAEHNALGIDEMPFGLHRLLLGEESLHGKRGQ